MNKTTYWKKCDLKNNLLGILIKQNSLYMCCVEIHETYTDKFILEEITYNKFLEITKEHNCLTLPEDSFTPSSSSSL